MSTAQLKKKLRRLRNRERVLLEELAQPPAMLRGSFTRVHTRCGKPTCWCAQAAKGHPHTRITWSQAGRMLTRKVPAEDVEQVRVWTANHRRYRAKRRALRILHAQIEETLDQLGEALIERTQRPLGYLATPQKKDPVRSKEVT